MSETTLSTERIYEGRILNLRVDTVQLENGKTGKREIVEHHGAVAMVPLTADGQVIFVRQWRQAAGGPLLEIPAGTLNLGEEPLACAHRELAEEINCAAGRMVFLFASFMAPGYTTEKIHTYAALDLTPKEGQTDEDEFLELVTLPLSNAIAKIRTGGIQDAKSISGLLMLEKLCASGEI